MPAKMIAPGHDISEIVVYLEGCLPSSAVVRVDFDERIIVEENRKTDLSGAIELETIGEHLVSASYEALGYRVEVDFDGQTLVVNGYRGILDVLHAGECIYVLASRYGESAGERLHSQAPPYFCN